MFNLKGSCKIVITDSRTGIVKQVIEKDNLVTDLTKSLIATQSGFMFTISSAHVIFISQNTNLPVANPSGIPILADSYTPSGVTKIQFFTDSLPYYGQIQQRIDFTGTARVFQTVGLRNNQNGQIYAYLLLDTPCTQGAFDILDIFYRIEFIDIPGNGIVQNPYIVDRFGRQFFGLVNAIDYKAHSLWIGRKNPIGSPYTKYGLSRFVNLDSPPGNSYISGSYNGSHFNRVTRFNINRDALVGWLFGSIQRISIDQSWFASCSNYVKQGEPFHPIFKHNQNAIVPFFDSLTFGQGNGNIYTSGTWTGRFPEMYRVTIVNSGATGVATYKFSVRKHLGFEGNTYSDSRVQSPYRTDNAGFHGHQYEQGDLLRYSNTKIVQYDATGVTLLDVFDGEYKNFDATTSPSLPVTNLRQCAVDTVNQKIYCGCRNTGLWVIDVNANTINQVLSLQCYGVDVGRNNVAYALVEGGLYASTDWLTPLSFSYTGITDSNWSRVYFLKVDPQNTEDRIAFSIQVPPSSSRVIWYRKDTGITSNGYSGSKNYPWSLDVSDTGGFWASIDGRLTFGSTSITGYSPSQPLFRNLTHSYYGTQNYGKITFYKELLLLYDRAINASGTVVANYARLDTIQTATGEPGLLHLGDGIVVVSTYLRQVFDGYNSLAWIDYEWNGSTWQEGNSGTKTTHTDNQPLINGLSIRFEDGASAPHFVANNYFTQSINYGLLKDNATSLDFRSSTYSVNVIFDAVQPPTTIPAVAPHTITIDAALNDPLYRRIEVDNLGFMKFKINGVDVTTIYIAGQSPGVGEISVNPISGVITFNAGDVGKTFSGVYSYLQI